MKYVVLAVLLLLAGAELTLLKPARPPVTPVVRLRTSDGFFVTLLQPRTSEPKQCSESIAHFEQAMKQTCSGCYVESKECVTHLAGMEDALAQGLPLPVYTVSAGETRMAILGPPGAVHAWCETVAAQMTAHGLPNAACRPPAGIRGTVSMEGAGR